MSSRLGRRTGRPPFPTIRSLRDALATARWLADEHAFVRAVALLDGRGRTCDLTLFTDPARHTEADALGWADCMLCNLPAVQRLVLFSVGATTDLSDEHTRWFLQQRTRFASLEVDLADWILTDGDSYRSVASTVCPEVPWSAGSP